ncbi:MAG TPA: cytochrome d ubiquinol oxidase subunit II [Gemmatimonadaceae bacterium]|nr:cytochrome d ubiquinol oxidase subunit II [Gemmatimonadaceae bacterium]
MSASALAIIVAGIAGVALTAYLLLGGADYGGGVWDLLASGPRRTQQRELIAHAIGPIWEANHVWLILIVVLLFTCFPPAFAALTTVLHIPLTLLLIGIVLRGSAFTFRAYDATHSAVQERWGMIFAMASVLAPVLLGIVVGAIASDGVGTAWATLGQSGVEFVPVFISSWLNAFTVCLGLMTLVMVAFLAATYLTVEAAHDRELQNDFRRRAIISALVLPVIAYATLVAAEPLAPRVHKVLLHLPIQIAATIAGLGALVALWTRRFRVARVCAAALVVVILWGWMFAQFPFLIPPVLTLFEAAAPPPTLRAFLGAIAVGFVVLIPSLWYLYGVFRGSPHPSAPETHH